MKFEWDDAKDQSNKKKHGVSFAEVRRLFESGEDYLEIFDAENSEAEDRFFAIGPYRSWNRGSRLHGTRRKRHPYNWRQVCEQT